MKSSEKRMPDSKGMTIRIPNDVLTDMRKIKALTEIEENRAVSLNELIIKATREFISRSNTV